MEGEQSKKGDAIEESMKFAVAVALAKSKILQKKKQQQQQSQALSNPTAASCSGDGLCQQLLPSLDSSEALKWKRKAKERKEEIRRLQEDLRAAEDGVQYDLFPQNVSCKCYFFDNMGSLSNFGDGTFNDVLRRRFLRQVRINERRKRRTGSSTCRQLISEDFPESELEQLRTSVDFLVELCETVSPSKMEQLSFPKWSHQAVDFILVSLKNLLPIKINGESVEGIVSSLITRLLRRMCTAPEKDGRNHPGADAQFYVQHLLRQLGAESFIGQRLILSVSQRISMVAESLLFMDPFDEAFPSLHSCMHMMIQLIEFLVSDYLLPWSTSEDFDSRLFEGWVASILHSRKGLELLENRNGLYVLYLDRVIGIIAKQVGNSSCVQNLNPDLLANLFS